MADESSKSDDPAPNNGADIPEIEAEIVEEGAPSAQEGVFTDREANADPTDAEKKDQLAPKRMPFTPGVILFFAFAAFALIVFAVWRLQGPGNAPVAEAQQPEEEALSIDSAPEDITPPEINQIEEPAPDVAGDALEDSSDEITDTNTDTSAQVDLDQGKIENNQFAELKNTNDDINPITDAAPGSDVFLPPLGSSDAAKGGNQGLQQAAKDAYRTFDPTAGSSLSGDENGETLPQTDDAPAFEFEDVDAGLEGRTSDNGITEARKGDDKIATNTEPEGFAALTNQADPSSDSSAENAKLLNDLSALKQRFEAEKMQLTKALEDERQRNAIQSEEIEGLRRDFQAAITARDEEATTQVLELRERLNKIRNDEVAPIARRVASVSALKSLERAFDEGRPFSTELDNFEQTAPGAPPITILRKYAGIGVVPMHSLKNRFGAAASNALAAARKEQAKGIGGALIAQAQNVITIRPAKPRPGSGPGAVISRAEYAVANNDLATALAELADLSPAGRDAMAPWIADAQARVDAISAMRKLNNQIFGALSQ